MSVWGHCELMAMRIKIYFRCSSLLGEAARLINASKKNARVFTRAFLFFRILLYWVQIRCSIEHTGNIQECYGVCIRTIKE